jgi:DNA-binding NarL/FixJ family response regulator
VVATAASSVKNIWVNTPGFQVAASTGDGAEAIKLAERLLPEIMLTDVSMKPVSGIEVTEKVKWLYPQVKVIGLSMFFHADYVRRMFNAGARGYVTKNGSREGLMHSIRQVLEGKEYVDPQVEGFVKQNKYEDVPSPAWLSARELEICRLIVAGNTSKEIGKRLNISFRTVDVHRAHIMHKLGLKNSVEIVDFLNRFVV